MAQYTPKTWTTGETITAAELNAIEQAAAAAAVKADLAAVASSGSYADLTNKPTIPAAAADATTTTKGIVQLAGDLAGTAAAPTVPGLATKAAQLSTQTQQTGTAYTLALVDGGTVVETTGAAITTVTVPANATAAFPVGTSIVVRQYGAGQVTIAAAGGVSLRSRGAALKLAGQYAEASLTKRATDEWVVSGDLTT